MEREVCSSLEWQVNTGTIYFSNKKLEKVWCNGIRSTMGYDNEDYY